MSSPEINWLKESIRALLLPELQRRGFELVPLAPDERRSEIGTAFPFGRLRRLGSDGFELVEIQLDKRGRAAFRLNLGVAPPSGVQHPITGHIAQEDVWVSYLDHSYELYERPLFRKWFSIPRRQGAVPTKDDYLDLVRKVVDLIPEVEELFREGKCGSHMREVVAR